MSFDSTLPMGVPDLMRASVFERHLLDGMRPSDHGDGARGAPSRLSSLSPSLLRDLMRFEQSRTPGEALEILEVLAACVRHARDLLLHVDIDGLAVPLTVFPIERLVHCPLPMAELLAGDLSRLQVLHVEPALMRAPGDPERALVGEPHLYSALGPLLWELALRGSRDELLPEIAGPVAYRLVPGVDLRGLSIGGTLAAAVYRLKRQTHSLREIAEWAGFDRSRAVRMLNGLYLQAGLMVSRTHPAATDGWFGAVR